MYAYDFYVNYSGNIDGVVVDTSEIGIRPVILLSSTNVISDGDGSVTNPYIIQ